MLENILTKLEQSSSTDFNTDGIKITNSFYNNDDKIVIEFYPEGNDIIFLIYEYSDKLYPYKYTLSQNNEDKIKNNIFKKCHEFINIIL